MKPDVHENKLGSQITGNRCTWRNLRSYFGRSVLVCITEAGGIHEAKRLGIVQEHVKDWLGIENPGIGIRMVQIERPSIVNELRVVILQSTFEQSDGTGPLFSNKRCTIRWRNSQEKE